jgi:arylsulfatase A
MNQRVFLLLVCFALFGCQSPRTSISRTAARPPNVVLIFCDDLGYADIGPYGSRTPTPNIDRLAREGMRFTDFYVPQAVCSASRAGLLTGCYPNRVGIQGALPPRARVGLNPSEITIAEVLKPLGYATAMFGKWHLGDAPQFLPTRQGFDEWFGLPYSNDMWPHHPASTNYPPLPLYENERVLELMPDQTKLTTWYTERAVSFIDRNKSRPFFLYVPHSMPHVPLFVSDKFKGKSGRGLYGDVIMEIDWSVGEILNALNRSGLDENTLVIFTSDNGPWLLYGNHSGSAGSLREGKGTSFDGGVRVPFIARWLGTIPRGATHKDYASTMDLLPTLARLAGTNAPADRVIDGRDISPVLLGRRVEPRGDPLFIYWGQALQAVRQGPWKIHFPHDYTTPQPAGADSKPGRYATRRTELELYNLAADPAETNNVAAAHPEVVARMEKLADVCRTDLGDVRTRSVGANVRSPGRTPAQ